MTIGAWFTRFAKATARAAGHPSTFGLAVLVILAWAIRVWASVLSGRTPAVSTEVPFEARVAVAGD